MIFKPLASIAKIVAGQSPDSSTYNSTGEGLPFFQGKADFQDMHPTVRMWCTSEKRKEAEPGDILISVRAPVGAVNICNQKSIIGRGLAAIRPWSELDSKFLYYWLKANETQIDALGTGSTFKAITQDTLKKIEVPVLPLDDQIRIAHLLGKVEGLIAQRKQHLQQLDDLLKSVFLEMFGDPVQNEKGWTSAPLEQLGSINRGVSKHRPRNDPKLLGGPYPLIQTGEVSNAGTYITKYTQTYSDLGFAQSKLWSAGTLCITIAANIAQTGILTFDACFPDSVVGFLAHEGESNTLYVLGLFWFFQAILEKNAPAAAQKNINLEILRALAVPKPPIELQSEFATIVEKVEALRSRYLQSLTDLEALYGALSQQAFKGELDLSRVALPAAPIEGESPVAAAVPAPITAPVIELPETDLLLPALQDRTQLAPLLRFWLEAHRAQLGSAAFSLELFIASAQTRLAELHPDNDFALREALIYPSRQLP
jgi:type I restriction enzyme S subunit